VLAVCLAADDRGARDGSVGRSTTGDNNNLWEVRLTPRALKPFLVGVLSAAAAIRKLPHTILTLVP